MTIARSPRNATSESVAAIGPLSLGPRPVPPRRDPMVQMSGARAHVLERLGEFSQPVTVRAVAEACGQHPNTVREHLDALIHAGLVTATQAPAVGRGRPAVLYIATPAEISRPHVREYAGLAIALAGHLSRTAPDARTQSFTAGRAWGETMHDPRGSATPQVGAVEATQRHLHYLGFEPDVGRSDADAGPARPSAQPGYAQPNEAPVPSRVFRLRQCPLLEAARQHPDVVCTLHLGVVHGLYATLGHDPTGTHLHAFAEPGACVLRLPHSAPSQR